MRIIDEHSTFRLWWDVFIVLAILATCGLIPFQLAFSQAIPPWSHALVYVIDAIFWLDILLNFCTSFRHHGEPVMDRARIARHYLRGQFGFDVIATVPLDLFFLGPEPLLVAGLPLVLVLRLPRLLRLLRLFVIVRRWERRAWSRAGYLRLAHLFMIFLILIHWLACAWILVPELTGSPAQSWIVQQGIADADPATRYIRSVYWVVATIATVGYGDILPSTNPEYVFAVAVMLLGAFTYAFIIGNIANLVRNLDADRSRYFRRVEAIGAYLDDRRVPPALKAQVRDYYDYLWAHHRGVREGAHFEELPPSFRLELLLQLTRDLLARVPLFGLCSPPLRNALLLALKPYTYAPGVLILESGVVGREIFFLSRGTAAILSEDRHERFGVMESGEYFGSLSLVLGEKRTACVQALTYCEVLVLDKEAFDAVRAEYPEFHDILRQIAASGTDRAAALLLRGVLL